MGFDLSDMTANQKAAVECGYFPLYRFDGESLTLDSELNEDKYFDFLRTQRRYATGMTEKMPLLEENKTHAIAEYNKLTQKAKLN